MTQKIVISIDKGGLCFSRQGMKWLIEHTQDTELREDLQWTIKQSDEDYREYNHLHSVDSDVVQFDYESGTHQDWYSPREITRDNPLLIELVETLGERAFAQKSGRDKYRLKIVEIPDDIQWVIDHCEYGSEWLREKSRQWNYDDQEDKIVQSIG